MTPHPYWGFSSEGTEVHMVGTGSPLWMYDRPPLVLTLDQVRKLRSLLNTLHDRDGLDI